MKLDFVVFPLFFILLTLKLLGIGMVAKWSWWMVTSPLWGGAVLAFSLAIIGALFGIWRVLRTRVK